MFADFLAFLKSEMEVPTQFGWFHIMFLVITVAYSAFLVWRYRDASDKKMRLIAFVMWIVLVLLEAYKQFVYSFSYADGLLQFDYQWYAFPFQFCSAILYALPFVVFLKDGKIRDAFMGFLASFSLFAGLAVMLYPGDVFIHMTGINIQTMVHHGWQVAFGIFMVAYNRKKFSWKFFARGILVFVGFLAVAMILNELVHSYFASNAIEEDFNMFYISPYYDCTLPILQDIYKMVPYAAFLAIYIFGFALVAAIVVAAEKAVVCLSTKANKKKALQEV